MYADLRIFYRQLHGANPSSVQLTSEEQAARKKVPSKVPSNVQSLEDYFTNRRAVRFRSELHGLMRDEVYNFVDGSRSYYDIYRAVRAEAMTTGSWYYGAVRLADVVGLLDAAVEAKVLSLK